MKGKGKGEGGGIVECSAYVTASIVVQTSQSESFEVARKWAMSSYEWNFVPGSFLRNQFDLRGTSYKFPNQHAQSGNLRLVLVLPSFKDIKCLLGQDFEAFSSSGATVKDKVVRKCLEVNNGWKFFIKDFVGNQISKHRPRARTLRITMFP
ncbi:hypothetical protein AVEN_188760-1 [Araneus ventricosus]|uniref:Uncharacterized protein n=1 Tax=Araneus ventricosus TaxID=182803 RepID=A0A4Y2SC25_ARAVE|nr:hypothetical protein AVEN_188760-1 [Araneus ventricosus]